jgi:GAF domain-containing protein
MAEEIKISPSTDKRTRYEELIPQVRALIAGETDLIANLSNIASALKYGMDFFWVGFYLVKNNELVLGPFQGPVACTRIAEGKGVCGTAMKTGESIIVPDVNSFPGHIACSSDAKSEIVLPAKREGKVILVLDVDSEFPGHFDETDREYLGKIIGLVENIYI